MKVLLLADINSEHIEKWALSLSAKGIDIGIFSLNRAHHDWYSGNKKITVLYQPEETRDHVSSFQKLNNKENYSMFFMFLNYRKQ